MAKIDGEVLLSLARDKSGKRRQLLAETISDLFSGKNKVLSERERTLMFDILHKIVHNAEMTVRRIIAEQLADLPDAPRDLIKLLANDEVEVAYSILRESDVLEDEDLIEVISRRTQEHNLAVSVRRSISEDVTDALVETGDESVITTLLKNSGASLSLATPESIEPPANIASTVGSSSTTRTLTMASPFPGDYTHRIPVGRGTLLDDPANRAHI